MTEPKRITMLRLPAGLEDVEAKPPSEMRETPEDVEERLNLARSIATRRYARRLPARFAAATLSGLTPEQNPEGKVSGWLGRGHQTLLLVSPVPGLGKTHAAYAVGAQAIEDRLWVEAWTVMEMLSQMRREMNDSENRDATLDDVTGCDLLILDDLGRENLTAWAQEQIHHVLDVRLREERRSIITTNLTSEVMGERYGYPLLDRVLADAVIAKVSGESRRRPAAW